MRQRLERALRTIAALGESDWWEPADFAAFDAARAVVADEIASMDRRTKPRATQVRRDKAADQREWQKARHLVAGRADGRCEAQVAPGCWGTGEHAHHVRMRSQGGTDDPSNLLWVCDRCHRWIHEHPADSYEAGHLARTEAS